MVKKIVALSWPGVAAHAAGDFDAILDRRQPAELQLDALLEEFPLEWAQQN